MFSRAAEADKKQLFCAFREVYLCTCYLAPKETPIPSIPTVEAERHTPPPNVLSVFNRVPETGASYNRRSSPIYMYSSGGGKAIQLVHGGTLGALETTTCILYENSWRTRGCLY